MLLYFLTFEFLTSLFSHTAVVDADDVVAVVAADGVVAVDDVIH